MTVKLRTILLCMFDGGYGREGTILLCSPGGPCEMCGMDDKEIIQADASEGEYKPARICIECIRSAVAQPAMTVTDEEFEHWKASQLETGR